MPRPSKTNVGVIGLGIIGSRVAARLRLNGYHVWVWNRSPRPEPNFLATPAEVAESARIIQIFVGDGDALQEVIAEMAPALTPGHIILNHATVSPAETLAASRMAEDRHAKFLDAPFTGSRDVAQAGGLVYYVGGDPQALESVRAVLEASAKLILSMGAVGEASAVKIATNLIAAATACACAEALALLHHNGVPLRNLPEALDANAACSPLTRMKLPAMILDDFEPRFALKHMFKDVQIALAMGAQAGIDLPAASAFAGAAMAAIQQGLAERDFSSIARLYGFPNPENPLDEQFRQSAPPLSSDEKPDAGRKRWNPFARPKDPNSPGHG
jgi:3-hydroxyisobutyrate dehydrogenase-like beta-hydroxyacid dehydrogenase